MTVATTLICIPLRLIISPVQQLGSLLLCIIQDQGFQCHPRTKVNCSIGLLVRLFQDSDSRIPSNWQYLLTSKGINTIGVRQPKEAFTRLPISGSLTLESQTQKWTPSRKLASECLINNSLTQVLHIYRWCQPTQTSETLPVLELHASSKPYIRSAVCSDQGGHCLTNLSLPYHSKQ